MQDSFIINTTIPLYHTVLTGIKNNMIDSMCSITVIVYQINISALIIEAFLSYKVLTSLLEYRLLKSNIQISGNHCCNMP